MQRILIRRTKISYGVTTALVGIPWTGVFNTWVNIIYNYKSIGVGRRHYQCWLCRSLTVTSQKNRSSLVMTAVMTDGIPTVAGLDHVYLMVDITD